MTSPSYRDYRRKGSSVLALRARMLGCRPIWRDGIFGWAWHCDCPGNTHGYNQQCSMLTDESLSRSEAS